MYPHNPQGYVFSIILYFSVLFLSLSFGLIRFHPLRSHAKEMDNKSFWNVYYEHLEMVAGLAGEFSLMRHSRQVKFIC